VPTAVETKDKVVEGPSAEEQLETIAPSVAERTVYLGVEPEVLTFVQKPLSFFGKLEFFSVMGKALDKAMSGDEGLSLSQLFEVPERSADGSLRPNDFKEADVFVKGLTKIAEQAPEVLLDLYCVILAVPRGSRDYVKDLMQESSEEGGLSDDDGFGILETFLAQNWEVMNGFFRDRIPALMETVRSSTAKEKEDKKKPAKRGGSRSSKP